MRWDFDLLDIVFGVHWRAPCGTHPVGTIELKEHMLGWKEEGKVRLIDINWLFVSVWVLSEVT